MLKFKGVDEKSNIYYAEAENFDEAYEKVRGRMKNMGREKSLLFSLEEEHVFDQKNYEKKESIDESYIPATEGELENLKCASDEILEKIGMRRWNDEKPILWLFPKKWYDSIPEGYEVVFIDMQKQKFKKGVTDKDTRYGLLAYGFLREE